jgi:hypothetical protein
MKARLALHTWSLDTTPLGETLRAAREAMGLNYFRGRRAAAGVPGPARQSGAPKTAATGA